LLEAPIALAVLASAVGLGRKRFQVDSGSRRSTKLRPESKAKRRLDETAYRLFSERGINAVGIDELIAQSGIARMTMYRHYKSKDDLILAFLDLRVKRWAFEWLVAGVMRRTKTPEARLLAIFELFHEWFQEEKFRGCQVVNVLIQSNFGSRTHAGAAWKLADFRSVIGSWATEAGLADAEAFALTWHIFMMGSIIAAQSGEHHAALKAHRIGASVLKSWPRQESVRREL